jgi:hypothetical protein
MTRQGEKKKKVDNDKLNRMLVDVFTFLEAVKEAKPSMCDSRSVVLYRL